MTLASRMKSYYEDRFRTYLPRRTYTLMRIDGKTFHTYTKGLDRPFDEGFIEDMNLTAEYLCKEIQGAKFAYVQSDEISILLTDFDIIGTDMWFDGNIQKMASVAASMATAEFNRLRLIRNCSFTYENDGSRYYNMSIEELRKSKQANFDARVWQIPETAEVENYFIWRQQDAVKNSIASVAQSLYSSKELHKKHQDNQQEMIFQKGKNWNNFPSGQKRGRFIEKIKFVNGVDVRNIPNQEIAIGDVVRSKWNTVECPIFTQDTTFLKTRIPKNNN